MAGLSRKLDAIGFKFGTDKSSVNRDYLNVYERFFCDRRNEPLKVLEIGFLTAHRRRSGRNISRTAESSAPTSTNARAGSPAAGLRSRSSTSPTWRSWSAPFDIIIA